MHMLMITTMLVTLMAACKISYEMPSHTQQNWKLVGANSPDYMHSVLYLLANNTVVHQIFYIGRAKNGRALFAGRNLWWVEDAPQVSLYDYQRQVKINPRIQHHTKVKEALAGGSALEIIAIDQIDVSPYKPLLAESYPFATANPPLQVVSYIRRAGKKLARLKSITCKGLLTEIDKQKRGYARTNCKTNGIPLFMPVFNPDTGKAYGLLFNNTQLETFSTNFIRWLKELQGLPVNPADKQPTAWGKIKNN